MFEDIDAIFGKDREKLLTDSVLTFSGDGRGYWDNRFCTVPTVGGL